MLYLLDTNTCIAYLNRSSQSICDYLLAYSPDEICVCDVVKYELYYGAYKSTRVKENLENLQVFFSELISLPFDGVAAEICGKIRATLQAEGTPIGSYDFQIAAIAIANNLTLVTHNTKEFERVPGLSIVDWQTD
jgi:tRNA(fMet)-specific endonuclease VapC